jgi:hypothetical protein
MPIWNLEMKSEMVFPVIFGKWILSYSNINKECRLNFMYESNPTAIIPPRATPGHLTYDYLRIGGHLTEVYSARSGI